MPVVAMRKVFLWNHLQTTIAAIALLAAANAAWAADADPGQTVECLLPGQIHNVGGHPAMGPRRPIQTTPVDCQQRGGEYTVQQMPPVQLSPLAADANDTVRCQLPKPLRQLGEKKQYYAKARTITTTRASCQARGGRVLHNAPKK